MDRDVFKWHIGKHKGRWWLIRPVTHQRPWIAEHVGTFAECTQRCKEISDEHANRC